MKTVTFDETEWQLVPKLHTQTMAEAFYAADQKWFGNGYKAMLLVAPQPKEPKQWANPN